MAVEVLDLPLLRREVKIDGLPEIGACTADLQLFQVLLIIMFDRLVDQWQDQLQVVILRVHRHWEVPPSGLFIDSDW